MADLPLAALVVTHGQISAITERATRLLGVEAETLRDRRVGDVLVGAEQHVFDDPPAGHAPGPPRPLPALSVRIDGSIRAVAYCLIPLPLRGTSLVLLERSDGAALDGASQGPPSSASYLIAGVAHEINNPLTFVTPALRELRRSLAAHEDSTKTLPLPAWLDLLDEALEGVSRIAGVIHRLRALREGKLGVGPTLVNEVALETLRLASASIPSGVILRRDFGMTQAVRGDRERLSQVVLNLVLNAAHALEDASGSGTIFVRTWTQADHTFVDVRDDGPGVPAALREKIFQPFFTTRKSGSGLGLALCRSMIRELGGELTLEQLELPGACFRIRLPLWRGPDSDPARVAPPESPSSAGETPRVRRRVLLVDDDDLVRGALARMLTKHHDVVQASSGTEAMAILEHQDFDVLLTDLVMSNGGGNDLIERIEAMGSPLARRVIVISGMAPDATPIAHPRLFKPCTAREVLRAIERVFSTR